MASGWTGMPSPLYVSVLLGFDSKQDTFGPNCQAQLEGIGAQITLQALQSPKVSPAGWVFGTHGDSDPAHLSSLIHEALDSLFPGHGLQLGFQLKQLWNDIKRSDQLASVQAAPTPTSCAHTAGLHVVHIDCERDHETVAKASYD